VAAGEEPLAEWERELLASGTAAAADEVITEGAVTELVADAEVADAATEGTDTAAGLASLN